MSFVACECNDLAETDRETGSAPVRLDCYAEVGGGAAEVAGSGDLQQHLGFG